MRKINPERLEEAVKRWLKRFYPEAILTKDLELAFQAGADWYANDPEDWISLSTRLPREGETVLTQHEEDLYPMPAYWVVAPGGPAWYAAHEGPEDENENLIRELLRRPTHWMDLPVGQGVTW